MLTVHERTCYKHSLVYVFIYLCYGVVFKNIVVCVCLSLQLYTIHVIQAGGSDKTPAIITRRYSEFQKLHVRLCRNHGEQMEHVCFPR